MRRQDEEARLAFSCSAKGGYCSVLRNSRVLNLGRLLEAKVVVQLSDRSLK